MCRWFTYISPHEPALLEDLLVDPANSLSHQVHDHYLPQLLPHDPTTLNPKTNKLAAARNSLYNLDGLGIAWYTSAQPDFHATIEGQRPALYKTISPPINDFNMRSLCANTASHAVFAHIRASSGSVVQQVNCHPFAWGRHVFMHNGAVANFSAIRREMCDLMNGDVYAQVSGGTDSEHLSGLYMTLLTRNVVGGDDESGKASWENVYPVEAMAEAMLGAVITTLTLQQKSVKEADRLPSSLNLAATDGTKMVTMRFRNCAGEEPPSLYYSTTAGVTLNRKFPGHPDAHPQKDQQPVNHRAHKKAEEHGKHVIVSSEPTTYDESEWTLVPKNTLVLVDEQGELSTRPVEYNVSFNAVDPDA